jgi:hypothetical protein
VPVGVALRVVWSGRGGASVLTRLGGRTDPPRRSHTMLSETSGTSSMREERACSAASGLLVSHRLIPYNELQICNSVVADAALEVQPLEKSTSHLLRVSLTCRPDFSGVFAPHRVQSLTIQRWSPSCVCRVRWSAWVYRSPGTGLCWIYVGY